MVDERYLANYMGGSILPVGMVWNYIGGIGIESNRCFHFAAPGSNWNAAKTMILGLGTSFCASLMASSTCRCYR